MSQRGAEVEAEAGDLLPAFEAGGGEVGAYAQVQGDARADAGIPAQGQAIVETGIEAVAEIEIVGVGTACQVHPVIQRKQVAAKIGIVFQSDVPATEEQVQFPAARR